MAQKRHWEQDKEATIYMGNIDERAPQAVIYEIALQMGPIVDIHMPRDRISQNHQGYGFIVFNTPADAEYAAQVLNGIKLYGKSLRVNKASADKQRAADVGAELFVGNLDHMVDEKVLYDTFSRFGPLLGAPKVAREDSGQSKGYGFVSYADFESSDAARANMDGQYLLGKDINVSYAYKCDGKGERHGDEAERQLAAQAKKRNIVPESQPLPAAFLAPLPSAAGLAPSTPSAPAGFDHSMLAQHGVPSSGSPALPSMPTMPPTPTPTPTMPPGFPHARNGPSPHHYGIGSPGIGGGMHHPPLMANGRGPGPVLPPAPTGLPARPPQGQGGYHNPADYHPGSFRPPHPSGATPPQGFPIAPPPGFPSVPPPGASPTPPPGFMPPPGFTPPVPPPGYPMHP